MNAVMVFIGDDVRFFSLSVRSFSLADSPLAGGNGGGCCCCCWLGRCEEAVELAPEAPAPLIRGVASSSSASSTKMYE
jgi:hypothetical protein